MCFLWWLVCACGFSVPVVSRAHVCVCVLHSRFYLGLKAHHFLFMNLKGEVEFNVLRSLRPMTRHAHTAQPPVD